MKKEVLLAIIIGLIFGLVITFGIYQANHYAKPKDNSTQSVTPTPSPSQDNSLFTLDSITNGDIFQRPTATISGSVKSGTFLVLLTENEEIFVEQIDNRFAVEIDLNTGANLIELIAITPEGIRQDLKLNLIYTTADLKDTQTATSSATTSVEEIQKSLSERIKKAIQGNLSNDEEQLKGFVGTVASIAENTITISSNFSEAKHLIVNSQTQIVRANNNVKLESVKIGEGIIGMGITSDMQTQESIRIVLYEPAVPKFSTSVQIGVLNEIDTDELTITTPSSTTPLTIAYSSRASFLDDQYKKIKASTLEEGQKVVSIISTNLQTQKMTLLKLVALNSSTTLSPSPSQSTCGDKVCQNIVCQGIGCPQPETPETCPSDCTK